MYEGIKLLNGDLPAGNNGTLVLDMKDAKKLSLENGASLNLESLTVLDNGQDASIELKDADGNIVTIILQNLNDALLQNATVEDAAPQFQLFQNGESLLSLTDINDLEAAAAGGEGNNDGSRFNQLVDQINQFIANNNLDRNDPANAGGANDGPEGAAFARNITFSGDLEAEITEDFGQTTEGIYAGVITNTDPHFPTLPFIAETVQGQYGVFVIDEDGNWFYNLDESLIDVQGLAHDQDLTETINIEVAGQFASFDINISIDGLNDKPEVQNISINDVHGVVVEDDDVQDEPQPESASTDAGSVLVFMDSQYVQTDSGIDSEGYNVQQTLISQGYDVSTITSSDSSTLSTALSQTNVLIMPENELWSGRSRYSNMSEDSKNEIFDFVNNGGTVILNGDGNDGDTSFLNAVFGFSLINGGDSGTYNKTSSADGSIYDSSPSSLPSTNGTYAIVTSSLPDNAISYYESSNGTTLFEIPVGDGKVTFIGYDWFNAAPNGSQDGGWLDILDITVENSLTPEPTLYETSTEVDLVGDDTEDENPNSYNGEINISDADITDTHELVVDRKSIMVTSPLDSLGQEIISTDDITISLDPIAETDKWEYNIEGDFSALQKGETATLTFEYYADDMHGFEGDPTNDDTTDEDSQSDPKTITMTITGTNDKPVIIQGEEATINADFDSELDETTSDGEVPDQYTMHRGTINGIDDDINDQHTISLVDTPLVADETSVTVLMRSEDLTEDVNLDSFQAKIEFDGLNGTDVVPTDFNPLELRFEEIVDEDGNFTYDYFFRGDFNALGFGESATVTISYVVTDDQMVLATDGINEASDSEVRTITLKINGTNDQPEIIETQTAPITETHDAVAYADGADNTQDDVLTTYTGGISGVDDDDNDTHTIALVGEPTLIITQDTQAPDQVEEADLPFGITFDPVVSSDGTFTTSYTLSGNFNALAAGETAKVTFQYAVTDSSGQGSEDKQSEIQTVELTITGTNDQPIVSSEVIDGHTYVVEQTHTIELEDNTIGYTYFTVTEETTITITTDGPTIDPNMYLLHNDSPLTSSSIIDYNDDGHTPAGSFNNSIITVTLQPGDYISAVSDYNLSEAELLAGFNDISDISTLTGDVTLTFTSDKHIDVEGEKVENTFVYETHDTEDLPGDDDTQDEEFNVLKGSLSVTDDDITDTHLFNVIDMPDLTGDTTADIKTVDINYVDGPVQVQLESTDINVDDIDLVGIKLLNNDGADRTVDFGLKGDFSHLAEGETATVTFAYNAVDDSEADNESDTSETKTVTITVTGTNDQPIVEDIVMGAVAFENTEDMRIPGSGTSGTIESEIEVENIESIEDLNVHINLNHTYDADLDIYLKAPDGTIVELTTDNGGRYNNFRNTEFNDEADSSIRSGRAPFNGSFRPEGDLSDFDGLTGDDLNGTWTLIITDDAGRDIGTLFNWGLEFNSETIFENSDNDATDTNSDDILRNDEAVNTLTGVLSVTDEDLNDTHTFNVLNMPAVQEDENIELQTISYDDGVVSTTDLDINVQVESSDVDVSNLTISAIRLLDNDGDLSTNFELDGDFTALAAGETATVTFAYNAVDSSDNSINPGETNTSETKTVTITVTGTNDQPVVDEVVLGVDTPIYETNDTDDRDDYNTEGRNWDRDNYVTQNDEYENALRGKLTVSDQDDNDGHIFDIIDTNLNGFVSTLAPEVLNDPNYSTHVERPVWDIDGFDDGEFDRPVSMVIESSDIDASEIDLDRVVIYSNDGDGREVDFKLVGDFTNLAAGEHATVTFTYNAIDDSASQTPGETNLSEPKTVTITVTGTNDEPVIEEVYNNRDNFETTIANAEDNAYNSVIRAGGTVLEANAAKAAAIVLQEQDGVDVPVEVRSSFVGFIDGQDDDLTDTHTLHMTDTDDTNTIAVQTDDGEFLASFDPRGNSILATDIKDLSIDFRTILDNQDSEIQEYSYLVNGNFSALGRGEEIHIEFDYYAKDDSSVGVNGESDESDVKTIHITIEGTNDQPVIMEYDHDVEIQETNQDIELPLVELGQIAYDTEYTKVLNELYDDTPFAYADEEDNGRSIYEEAVAAASMAGEIARAAVVDNDELTVFGDGLGTVYNNDLIIGHDDDINDKHVLRLVNLDTDGANEQELLVDFSTSNVGFNSTGSDVKAVFTTDSANVTAADIKDVSVIFNTTSDQEGSTEQEYSYQVVGNYNALATGETATITFAYKAFDNSGSSNETRGSETKEITLTITGTNDKPEVTANKVYDAVLENNDNAIADMVTVEDAPEVTTIRHTFDQVIDDDNSDTHEFNIETSHDADIDRENGFELLETPVLYTDNDGINDFIALQIKLPANVDADDIKIKSIKVIGGEFVIEGEFDALAGALGDNPADELQIKFKYYADDQNDFDGEDGSNESSISDSEFITVKVTGTNDKPLITVNPSDTRMVEDSPLIVDTDAQTPGVQGMLTTLGSLRIEDVDHDQSSFDTESETFTSGTNDINLGGTLSIAANGDWTYEVDNSNPEIQALKLGESIEQVYTVTSLDGTAEQTITVSVHGTEDSAIITGDITGGVKEEDTPPTLSTTGSLTIEDRDNFPHEVPNADDGQNLSLSFISSSDGQGQLGGIVFTNPVATYPVGSVDWTYSVANNDTRVQALGEGKTIVQKFLVTSQDGGTDETITITITGTNDVPTLDAITSPTIVDTEAEDTFNDIVGQLVGDDVDTGTVLTYSVAGTDLDVRDGIIEIKGDYGTLVLITSTGGYTYTPDADAINALAPDDAPVTDTFTFVSNDGTVDSLPQDLVIQITPADDTPVIIDEPDFSVIEDGDVFNGTLEASDVDTDLASLTYEVVGATPAGLVVNPNGTYSFDPSVEAYQSLPDGVTTTVSFQWKATDENSYTATDTVTVTITGTNDGATIVNAENFVVEAEVEQNFLRLDTQGVVTEDVSQNLDMSDFARVTVGIKAIDVTGTFGPSQNGTNWNDAFKFSVLEGETINLTLVDGTPADSEVTLYKVTSTGYELVTDATGAGEYIARIESATPSNSGDYQLRIAIIGDDVKEDVTLTVSGEMEVLDVDAGENVFQVQTNVQSTYAYGEFSITETGTWNYNLFNNDQRIQALAEGEELFDTFRVTSFDGTATNDVVIKIAGTNDLPIATVHTDTLTDTTAADNLFSSVNVVSDDRAADLNDLSETYSIKDGSVSIASITVDGVVTAVTGLTAVKNGENIDFTAGDAFDFLDNGEVAEVTINYMLDDGTQAVASTHVITINGTNDLPVITSSATFDINEHDALDHADHDAIESNEYDLGMTQAENIANNALVGQVIATDAELDNLEYVITKVNNQSPQDLGFNKIFHINSDGKIFLVQNVDAEVEDTYTIDVRVSGYNTDGSINYTTQQITVNVADLNDNAPVLTYAAVETDIDENNMAETNATPVLLGNFTIADADLTQPTGSETENNFEVDGADKDLVEVVDNLDGTFSLYLKAGVNLNHEDNDSLDVTVIYNDGLHDSNTIPVSIAINDINEAPIAEDDVLVAGTVLVSEDFESGATGWSNNSTDFSSGELGSFLGRFGSPDGINAVSKLFDFGIANAGKTVTVEFDMYEIDSWDGEAFKVFINTVEVSSEDMRVDSHYGETDGGTSTASNEFTGWGSEDIHHYSFLVTLDTDGKVELGFGSGLGQSISDESFGIDNVSIIAVEDLVLVTEENTDIVINVLSNDFDVDDGDSVSINSFETNPAAGGTVEQTGDTLVFKPGSDFDYLTEGATEVVTFTYDVKDVAGLVSNQATVTVVVTGTNDAPVLGVFAPTNLIANGSFENFTNPTTTGWGARVDGFDSWTATTTDNQLDAVAEGHGVQETHEDTMVDMDGSGANVSLTQDVAGVNDGETYLLSFDIAQRNVGTTSELEVYWNGVLVDTFTPNGITMQTISVEVVGAAGTNSITFTEVGNPDSSGTYLDNVVLQASVLSVDENSVDGTVVGQAVSTDPDGGAAVYSIVDDATVPFTIDSATGEITVDGPIDYEALGASKTIDVEVKVIDQNGGEDTQIVSVNVNDLNDNAPVVSLTPVISIDENSTIGTKVADISVSDADTAGVNSVLTSAGFVIDGADKDLVEVTGNAQDGFELVLKAALDYDTNPANTELNVTVTYNDGVNTPASVDTIAVDVNNLNDNAPEVNSKNIVMFEGSTDVNLGLTATDADGDTLSIKFTNLPINGTVTLSDGTVVNTTTVYDVDDLEGLQFDATSVANSTLTYVAMDGDISHNTTGTVNFNVQSNVLENGYVEYNGHYYKDFGTGLVSDARTKAIDENGKVVLINDANENSFIDGLVNGDVWVNATDENAEAGNSTVPAAWTDFDGNSLNYLNFKSGEPNNYGSGEDYVEMHNGGLWNDIEETGVYHGENHIVVEKESNTLNGTSSDETLSFSSDASSIDGKDGTDTLIFTESNNNGSGELDIGAILGNVNLEHIEELDLTNGAHILSNIKASEVFSMTDTDNELKIVLDSDDSFDAAASGWDVSSASIVDNGDGTQTTTYAETYTNPADSSDYVVKLLIQEDIV